MRNSLRFLALVMVLALLYIAPLSVCISWLTFQAPEPQRISWSAAWGLFSYRPDQNSPYLPYNQGAHEKSEFKKSIKYANSWLSFDYNPFK